MTTAPSPQRQWPASSASILDADHAPLAELDRELARLVRRYRTASHLVAEQGVRPGHVDDATLEWWITAHRAVWRRRFELRSASSQGAVSRDVELRKDRLRKPPR